MYDECLNMLSMLYLNYIKYNFPKKIARLHAQY